MPRNSKAQQDAYQPQSQQNPQEPSNQNIQKSSPLDSSLTIQEAEQSLTKSILPKKNNSNMDIPPSNGISEEDEVSSLYMRYITHLCPQEYMLEDEEEIYWEVVYKCLLYLKRQQEELNIEMNHLLMGELFKNHFNLDRLQPTNVSNVGKMLLNNGYFLAAYALYVSEKRKSPKLIEYYLSILQNRTLKIGKQQMIFFLKLLIERQKSEPKEVSMSQAVVRRSFEDLSPLISRTP